MRFYALSFAAAPAAAMVSSGYQGYGFIGYGIPMYHPPCAHACRSGLSGYMLKCSDMVTDQSMDGMDMKRKRMDMGGSEFTTSPSCYATDDMFLESLAYCMSTHCEGLPASDLEFYWEKYLAGNNEGQPTSNESYTTVLLKTSRPPIAIVAANELLNTTTLVDEATWLANYNADTHFKRVETLHVTYGSVSHSSATAIY